MPFHRFIKGTASVAFWFVTNAVSTYYSKKVMHSENDKEGAQRNEERDIWERVLLAFWLSFFQLFFSGVIGALIARIQARQDPSPFAYFWEARKKKHPAYKKISMTAAFNALGSLCVNIAYIYGSVSLIQVIKSLEPVTTYVLSLGLLKTGHSPSVLLSIVMVVVGTAYSSWKDSTCNLISIAVAMVSNFMMPLRNVIIKSMEGSTHNPDEKKGHSSNYIPQQPSGFAMFSLISAIGSAFVGSAILVFTTVMARLPKVNSTMEHDVILSSLLFFGYNGASLVVLGFTDPITHSILNVLKRFFNILCNVVLLDSTITKEMMKGLFVTFFGTMLFTLSKNKSVSMLKGKRTINTFVCVLVVSTIYILFNGSQPSSFSIESQKQKTNDSDIAVPNSEILPGNIESQKQKTNDSDIAMPNSEILPGGQKSKVVFYNLYKPESYSKENLTLTESLAITAGNVGNLVWQYGATNLIDKSAVELIDRSFGTSTQPGAKNVDAVFFPVANILGNRSLYDKDFAFNGRDMIRQTTIAVLASDSPTLLLGAGTQAFFHPASEDKLEFELDLNPNGQIISTPEMYKLHQVHLQFLSVLSQYTDNFFVRGSYTEKVCHNHGFQKAKAVGCPSLLISPNPQLGVSLKKNFDHLRTFPTKKVAVNLPPYYAPQLISLFLSVVHKHPGSKIILQDNRDVQTLRLAQEKLGIVIPESDLLYFYRVPEWQDYICSNFDAVFGGRIHGSMIGIECELPTFIVAPDMRVLELAEEMLIPHTDIFDPRLTSDFDLNTLLVEVGDSFDANAFDKNRCRVARIYVTWMEKHNVPPNPSLYKLCGASFW